MWMKAQKRQGNIVPLVAIALIPIVSVVAIALEGGWLLDHRRQVQATADASAFAAAADLYANWSKNQGRDPSGTAKTSALSIAAANGLSNDNVTSVVTVTLAPDAYQSGPNAGQTIPD